MRSRRQQPKWCDEGLVSRVGSMWYAYRCSKGLEPSPAGREDTPIHHNDRHPLRQILFRWSNRCKFLRAQQATRKHGRELKKQRFLDILQEAKTAIQNNNQHGLFRIVRSLAPKQKRSNMQVYGPKGELVSRNREIEILRRHFTEVWKSPLHWIPPSLRTPFESPCDIHFIASSARELCHAVDTIRAHKAVPSVSPPAAIWKQHGAIIGQAAHRITTKFWAEGGKLYPETWRDTYLVLLQKPNKPQGLPSSLRPVGLQDPLAKAYTSILTRKLTPYALAYLKDTPQFAYVSGRDILGSLERAVRHCKQVRARTKAGSYNIWNRRYGRIRQEFTVGLQASLDLSQAFDTVPWSLLESALDRAAVPTNLKEAIMTWVSSTRYVIEHRQQTIQIQAERGVRQGCGLSPLLWSFSSGLVYKEFCLSQEGMQVFPNITLFADDHHLSWVLNEPQEIPLAIEQLRSFISFLRQFGLQVNPSKSQAILMIHGQASDKLRQA